LFWQTVSLHGKYSFIVEVEYFISAYLPDVESSTAYALLYTFMAWCLGIEAAVPSNLETFPREYA
jgi:hypothetical protein